MLEAKIKIEEQSINNVSYTKQKIKASEELLLAIKEKIDLEMPHIWQLKQMYSYVKNMKEIRKKLEHLGWLLDNTQEKIKTKLYGN